jgi:hypothetical protein
MLRDEREVRYPVRYQYIVCPVGMKAYGELVGKYQSSADAYAAAIKRAPGTVPYIHCEGDFPRKMSGPNDTAEPA